MTIASVLPVASESLMTASVDVPDALCFDLLAAYLIAAGDTERGFHENEPDRVLNADTSRRLCDMLLPLVFYDPQRLVVCVDSDMNKVALFKWFASQER
jgi:hypothetical protein